MAHEPHDKEQTVGVHEELDTWHRHDPSEGRAQHEHGSKVDPFALAVTFGLITFVVLALTGGLTLYFSRYATTLKQERDETTVLAEESARMRAEAEARMAGYAWVDPAAGRVSIPLQQAADRVVAKYAGRAAAEQESGGPRADVR